MARINIEDSLFKDKRFTDLCIKMLSRRLAIGALVEAWILAQQFVTIENPSGLIPLQDWKDQEICDDIILCKLAKVENGFVEIVGGKSNFAWLVTKKENAAKGGEANKKRIDSDSLKGAYRKPNEAKRSPLTPSLSLSPTLSLNSNSNSLKEDTNEKNMLPEKIIKNNRGCLSELMLHEISTELFNTVTAKTQNAWLAAYPKPQWICHEALKANAWFEANPKKKPKDFGKFFTNWLSNGFEYQRKGIPSNSKNKTFVQQAADSNERIRQQLQKEIDEEENERETNHDVNN